MRDERVSNNNYSATGGGWFSRHMGIMKTLIIHRSTNCTATDPGSTYLLCHLFVYALLLHPQGCSNAHSSCGCLGHSCKPHFISVSRLSYWNHLLAILILLSNQLVCAAEKSQDQRDLREEEVGEASDLEVLRNPFLCCCRTSCSPGNFLVDVIPE